MSAALIGLAAQMGAPLVERILGGRIGAGNAELAGEVIREIAARAGSTPDRIDELAARGDSSVERALREVEAMAPEMIALYSAGLDHQFGLLRREMEEPLWTWAWRPLGMYGLGALWIWNIIALHVANAVWKIALPQMDLAVLLQLTALYMTLYMGGHTLKDVARNWRQPQ